MKKYLPVALLGLLLPAVALADNKSKIVDENAMMISSSLSEMETCAKGSGEPYASRRTALELKLRELVYVAGFDVERFWTSYRKKIDAYQFVDSAGLRAGMSPDGWKRFRSNCEMSYRVAVSAESHLDDAIGKMRRAP